MKSTKYPQTRKEETSEEESGDDREAGKSDDEQKPSPNKSIKQPEIEEGLGQALVNSKIMEGA